MSGRPNPKDRLKYVLLILSLVLGLMVLLGALDLAGVQWESNPFKVRDGKTFGFYIILIVCALRVFLATVVRWRRAGT